MSKNRRIIKDSQKTATVSKHQVITAAKTIKENRAKGGHAVKSDTYKDAPRLHRKK